ncbi:MAG: efflux transporter periplasmic adaptor subunit [Betaproteobacteria bacterium RBG_16_58_11]|nr:MAG: efflux transporter periplasmic adaptor subunit [Betaproteobacteria bacterium RBG_16_58_11]
MQKFKALFSRTGWLGLILVLALGGGAYFAFVGKDKAQARYKTQAADVGDIHQVITANGTLNPVVLVNVGTQVSGTVKRLHVDFNNQVTPGQVLAELDPSLFQAALHQSEANQANSDAGLKLAQAKEKRARELLAKNFISQTAMDEAAQAFEAAQAQARLARAQVERDRINLRYAVIRSPIAGVVVARSIDVGQTVAASFQTPTLFQIAKDLRDMQIDSSVAEADVGAIFVGQSVRFTVDAFQDKNFNGKVKQIRLNPTVQQNVVTYNVVVGVDNSEGQLLPGMTAHVKIAVADRKQVLRIPNAVLRFKPETPEEEGGKNNKRERKKKEEATQVYRLEKDDKLVPVKVKLGITDGTHTEIVEGDLKAGDALVVKDTVQKKSKEKSSFSFRMF